MVLDIGIQRLRSNKAARHPVSADVATFAAAGQQATAAISTTVEGDSQQDGWVRPRSSRRIREHTAAIGKEQHQQRTRGA